MKYYNKKFYIDECAPECAKSISNEYWEELLLGEREEKEIYWDDSGYPRLRIPVVSSEIIEQQNKLRRTVYIDAYRKYQASVNYGEFERIIAVDEFITKLRNKDWTAFDDIPPQIKYFTGECGFEESGLKAGG